MKGVFIGQRRLSAVRFLGPRAGPTLHAFGHDAKEFRTDNRGAFFTWVGRLSGATVEEEELVTTMPVQDRGCNSRLRTYLFLRTNGVGKHHRAGVPGIPLIHLRAAV